MFCRVWSMVIHGVEAVPVRVEADVSDGMPMFTIVGYVSAQVREAQGRVRDGAAESRDHSAAEKNCDQPRAGKYPKRRAEV